MAQATEVKFADAPWKATKTTAPDAEQEKSKRKKRKGRRGGQRGVWEAPQEGHLAAVEQAEAKETERR